MAEARLERRRSSRAKPAASEPDVITLLDGDDEEDAAVAPEAASDGDGSEQAVLDDRTPAAGSLAHLLQGMTGTRTRRWPVGLAF